MAKNLLFLFLLSSFFSLNAFSQGKRKVLNFSEDNPLNIPGIVMDNTCDSIGWPLGLNAGVFAEPIGQNYGYYTGTNAWGDKGKANYLDLSASSATYILRAIIGLGPVNTKSSAPDLTRNIFVRVYDGTSGTPGSILGTYTATLEEMRTRRLNLTVVVFPSPIALPASKKIFLGVDFSNINWAPIIPVDPTPDPTIKDTLAVLHTGNGQNPPLAWEQYSNNNWISMRDSWSDANFTMALSLHLYPLVSTDPNACNTLPVTFGGFSGQQTQDGNLLTWNTWTETGSKQFDVERSNDGDKFVTIHSQPSKAINGNHTGALSYRFTDKEPSPGVNFYRIKQVDNDGEFTYSKTIKLSTNLAEENSIIRSHYPNPAGQHLYIQLANGIRDVELVKFTDVNGRMLGAQKPAVSPDGLMKVNTNNLRSGLNFATIELQDGRSSTIKVIKE